MKNKNNNVYLWIVYVLLIVMSTSFVNAQVPNEENLLTYYRLDETSGNTITSFYNNYTNNVPWTIQNISGVYDNALNLPTYNQRGLQIKISDYDYLYADNTKDLSVNFILKIPNTPNFFQTGTYYRRCAYTEIYKYSNEYFICIGTSADELDYGKLMLSTNGFSNINYLSDEKILLGEPNQISLNVKGNQHMIYVNGELIYNQSHNRNSYTNNIEPNLLGGDRAIFASIESFESVGFVDEYIIYNKSLSSSEVQSLNSEINTYNGVCNETITINNTGVSVDFSFSKSPYLQSSTLIYGLLGNVTHNKTFVNETTYSGDKNITSTYVFNGKYDLYMNTSKTENLNCYVEFCKNNWVQLETECNNNLRNITYIDTNNCEEQYDKPNDAGSIEACNVYGTEDETDRELWFIILLFVLYLTFLIIGLFNPVAHIGTLIISMFLMFQMITYFDVSVIMGLLFPIVTFIFFGLSMALRKD